MNNVNTIQVGTSDRNKTMNEFKDITEWFKGAIQGIFLNLKSEMILFFYRFKRWRVGFFQLLFII